MKLTPDSLRASGWTQTASGEWCKPEPARQPGTQTSNSAGMLLTYEKNNRTQNTRQDGQPECAPSNAALGKAQAENETGQRFLVRLTSVRRRLLDEDNLVGKYHTDLLRYAGIISSDAPGKTRIETRQRKAAKGEEEVVIIEVYETTI